MAKTGNVWHRQAAPKHGPGHGMARSVPIGPLGTMSGVLRRSWYGNRVSCWY